MMWLAKRFPRKRPVARITLYSALRQLYEASCANVTMEQMNAAMHPDNPAEHQMLCALQRADETLQNFESEMFRGA